MEHYGEKKGCCEFDGRSALVSMKFQVSDVRNPLASAARITEHGNTVQFGPKNEDNCISHPRFGEKAMMRRKGRKVILDAILVRNGSACRGQAQAERGEYRQRASCRGSGTEVRKKGSKIFEKKNSTGVMGGAENMEQDDGERLSSRERWSLRCGERQMSATEKRRKKKPKSIGKSEEGGSTRKI